MFYTSYDSRTEELVLLEFKEKDTSYGGWEMMLGKVVWKYWSRSCVRVLFR